PLGFQKESLQRIHQCRKVVDVGLLAPTCRVRLIRQSNRNKLNMSEITVRGARLHNLKNVSFSIPKNRFVVFTGVSGSGKSTMAFDTLHKEGQRQYMESLGMVTYESRPPVDAIVGLSPSISVDQHNSNRSPRSTFGTATDVYTYLRILFARTGHRPCPNCGADVPPEQGIENVWEDEESGG